MKPFVHHLRVRYHECDAQKVVFNSRYGEYVDIACGEFMRSLGYYEGGPNGNPELQLVRQVTEWKSPARYDDELEVSVAPLKLGNTSLVLRTEIRRRNDPTLLAHTETTYVHVDPKTWTSSPIPDPLRKALQP
jgi:acyl-CoA thioester hydrolase